MQEKLEKHLLHRIQSWNFLPLVEILNLFWNKKSDFHEKNAMHISVNISHCAKSMVMYMKKILLGVDVAIFSSFFVNY